MKKLTAISFTALLLFNLFGYKLIFYYAQKQAAGQLEASLDSNLYNEADLITIKLRLSLPYQSVSAQFERFNGEVKVNGKLYRYVKRRFFNGELTLLCLPDVNSMHLEKAKDNFFKQVNGLAANTGPKNQGKAKTDLSKVFSSEYGFCVNFGGSIRNAG